MGVRGRVGGHVRGRMRGACVDVDVYVGECVSMCVCTDLCTSMSAHVCNFACLSEMRMSECVHVHVYVCLRVYWTKWLCAHVFV